MKRIVIVLVAAALAMAAASSASARRLPVPPTLPPTMICDCGGAPWPSLLERLLGRSQEARWTRLSR
jgi:hypothetical protein